MPKKTKSQQRMYDFVYFVSVLAAASMFLAYFSAAYTEMTFEKRTVAGHMALALNAVGIDAVKYNNVVRIHGNELARATISKPIARYFSEAMEYGDVLELRAASLSREDEGIVSAYVREQQAIGNRVYLSTATVSSVSNPFLEIDIIPECVGWLGIFAVSALIIAYPRVEWRKRILGLVIALPLMHAVNVIRLATTFAAGYYFSPEALYFTHDILWKTVLVFWALALWLFWVYFVVEEKQLSDLKKAFKRMFLKPERVRKK
ncbi:MAG: exosortase/archaeosortase family protein [archaeon]